MTRQLRSGKGRNGLVLANGGTVTYQYAVCLSSQAPSNSSYPEKNPLPPVVDDVPVPKVDAVAEGDAVVEVSRNLPVFTCWSSQRTNLMAGRHIPLSSTATTSPTEAILLVV